MGYRVTWTDRAYLDLLDIADYGARHLHASSRPLISKLVAAVRRLETFPRSGRIVPDWGDPDLREVIVPPYRVIYRIVGREIVIYWVIHSRRSLPSRPDHFVG